MNKKEEYTSHWCPEIDDNYGKQVVKLGDKCPFCGKEGNDETTSK